MSNKHINNGKSLISDPSNNVKKKSLLDVVGILGPIPDEVKEKSKVKSFQTIKEEAITKYFQEKYETREETNQQEK